MSSPSVVIAVRLGIAIGIAVRIVAVVAAVADVAPRVELRRNVLLALRVVDFDIERLRDVDLFRRDQRRVADDAAADRGRVAKLLLLASEIVDFVVRVVALNVLDVGILLVTTARTVTLLFRNVRILGRTNIASLSFRPTICITHRHTYDDK